MAEIEANVILLTDTTLKLKFINFDAPRSAGITEVTYDGNTFNVIFDGYDNNSYVIVEATGADFDGKSRVIIEADIPEPTNDSLLLEDGDNILLENGDLILLQ
jgi:hypothetical protein